MLLLCSIILLCVHKQKYGCLPRQYRSVYSRWWNNTLMERSKFTRWIETKSLRMRIQTTSKILPQYFACHGYRTYWQEYGVNFVISAVFYVRSTSENREVTFTWSQNFLLALCREQKTWNICQLLKKKASPRSCWLVTSIFCHTEVENLQWKLLCSLCRNGSSTLRAVTLDTDTVRMKCIDCYSTSGVTNTVTWFPWKNM